MREVVPYQNGLISFPVGHLTRYSRFWESACGLYRHDGDAQVFTTSTNICENRNEICRTMLRDERWQWVLFLDDDHTFDQNALNRLLAWPEPNDIISAAPIQKTPPYGTVAFDIVQRGEKLKMKRIAFSQMATRGLFEVDALGFGFVVVRRRVIEAMSDPWFTYGRWDPSKMQEDVNFCVKAKFETPGHNFRIFMDCGVNAGHIVPVVVNRSDDGRGIKIELGGNPRRNISFFEPTLMEEFQKNG